MKFKMVTILFSGIVGFSQFCAKNSETHSAMKIVQLLNTVYTEFDKLLTPEKNANIYKVRYSRRPTLLALCSETCGHTA